MMFRNYKTYNIIIKAEKQKKKEIINLQNVFDKFT